MRRRICFYTGSPYNIGVICKKLLIRYRKGRDNSILMIAEGSGKMLGLWCGKIIRNDLGKVVKEGHRPTDDTQLNLAATLGI